jgi:UPF0148 protein
MDEDKKLERITKLLEQGCTMLATHHDCGAPLFRCKGELLCPVCSYSSEKSVNDPQKKKISPVGEKDQPKMAHPEGTSTKFVRESDEPVFDVELEIAKQSLKKAILYKLRKIADDITMEQDPSSFHIQLECIDVAFKVLRVLDD